MYGNEPQPFTLRCLYWYGAGLLGATGFWLFFVSGSANARVLARPPVTRRTPCVWVWRSMCRFSSFFNRVPIFIIGTYTCPCFCLPVSPRAPRKRALKVPWSAAKPQRTVRFPASVEGNLASVREIPDSANRPNLDQLNVALLRLPVRGLFQECAWAPREP